LYKALLTGLQHMGITNLIDVVAKAVQQGVIFLILLMHGSIFHVAYWISASMALQVIVTWAVCGRYFSLRALLLPGFSFAVVKENIKYASGLFTISICSWITSQIDKVIISKLLPLTQLGIYTFARGAINQGMLLTGSISGAIFPHFSALHGAGKTVELRKAYDKIQDLICFGTIPVFAGVPFVTLPLFSRVFDLPSARMLLVPCTLLAIGYYMNGAITTPYVVSLAVGRPDIAARQNVLGLLIVTPASAAAIYWFGLSGAGFSWVIYHIYAYSYGLPRMCRECVGMAPRLWYWHVFRIMGAAFLIYGSIWRLIAWGGNFSLLALAAGYIAGSVIYCAFAFWVMGDELRTTIMQYVTRGRGLLQRVVVAP
jgi:O-antigen/teichoic acid export membrane protein